MSYTFTGFNTGMSKEVLMHVIEIQKPSIEKIILSKPACFKIMEALANGVLHGESKGGQFYVSGIVVEAPDDGFDDDVSVCIPKQNANPLSWIPIEIQADESGKIISGTGISYAEYANRYLR